MPHPAGPQSLPAPDGLSQVALWTAAAHAAEYGREAPYVRDPWAGDFLHAAGYRGGPPGDGPMQRLLPEWAVVRSRFFDEHLVAAARAGCRQVVLLGAGLDTRAFRLDWPTGVHVFEVADPALLAFKEYVLDGAPASCGRRSAVGADPAGDWRAELLAAGFDPARPTAWLAETLLYHLPPETVESVVTAMTELSAPGSTFGAECVNAETVTSSFVAPFLDALADTGLAWHWRLAEPERWWAGHHWDARVADPFTLPYAVERLGPCLPMLPEAAARTVFLITGTLRT
ncbi:SAM-dependent methyltransferase [Streptomyces fumanus]|uniref:S-adenosyl-L-methionine-dependent methyltransferase n=1 Tax=Streptomyces fumanus TaxID=67302 RepID=A0A919EAP4_9ACTN|nr:SAM-dependent methyltransferase [Streptomyces fumanus]GHF29119.1 S-adenosyl-L-methionine-dependent methyltransferase [Streptomyces fumanus]